MMKRVRLLQSLVIAYNKSYQSGYIHETTEEEANRLIAGGMAEAIGPDETRAVSPPTNRMKTPKTNRKKQGLNNVY